MVNFIGSFPRNCIGLFRNNGKQVSSASTVTSHLVCSKRNAATSSLVANGLGTSLHAVLRICITLMWIQNLPFYFDLDPSLHSEADLDPNSDSDPTYQFDADPDPTTNFFQIWTLQRSKMTLTF